MKFFAFAASHRKASLNRKLAIETSRYISDKGHEVIFEEYAALDMPSYDDERCADILRDTNNLFAERAMAADGIIVSSPEYNWSYPGTLKNIIDWTSRIIPCPLAGKTVLLLSATPSMRGGINGLMQLRTPFESVQAIVYPRVFPLGNAETLLASGSLQDTRLKRMMTGIIDDYLTFTQKLRS